MDESLSDFLNEFFAKDKHCVGSASCHQVGQPLDEWDSEMTKLFQQTASALQKISPGLDVADLGPLLGHKRRLEDGPRTCGQCAMSEPQVEADQTLGSPSLHKLTSLESLAFNNLMSAADAEVSTACNLLQVLQMSMLPWDAAANGAAIVSVPPTSLKEGEALLGSEDYLSARAIKAASNCQMTTAAGMVPVDFVNTTDITAASGEIKSESTTQCQVTASRESKLSLPTATARHSKAVLGSNDASDLEANTSTAGAVEGRQLPLSRLSKRRLRAPKWQAAYEATDEIGSPSPDRSKESQCGDPALGIPKKAGRKRLPVDHITLDSLQQQGLFDVPIQTAAQELGVGLSVLKRICRQLGLARWPFRTRQSLRGVIAKTEQYLAGDEDISAQKAEVVDALQKTLNGLQGEAGQGLSDSVRKYRQSVFKLNYKIKKNAGRSQAAKAAARPAIPATAAARMAAASAHVKADCAEGACCKVPSPEEIDELLLDPFCPIEGWETQVHLL